VSQPLADRDHVRSSAEQPRCAHVPQMVERHHRHASRCGVTMEGVRRHVRPPGLEAPRALMSSSNDQRAHDAGLGPENREWGARELGLQDPNGYFLTFTEPA
jgi:hypothetical protein